MSSQRLSPLPNRVPLRGANDVPARSGEYRFVGERDERRKRPSATTQAVRPEIRRTTSMTDLPAVPARASTPTRPTGPRRYSTVKMQALPNVTAQDPGATPSAARQLDDDLAFDFDIDADGALELDCVPSSRRGRGSHGSHGSHGELPTPATGIADLPLPPAEPAEPFPPPEPQPPPPPRRMTPSPLARVTPASIPRMAAPPMDAAPPRRTSGTTMPAVDAHAALVAFAGFGEPPASLWKTPAYALRVARRKRSLRADLVNARARRSNDVGIYEASLRSADDSAVRNGVIMIATMASFVILLALAALWFAR
jgi:hypothetical protein